MTEDCMLISAETRAYTDGMAIQIHYCHNGSNAGKFFRVKYSGRL